MKCLICGSSASKIVFDDRGFRVRECQGCKFGIVEPLPDVETLTAMYNSQEYFATHMHYDYDSITQAEIETQVTEAGRLHKGILGGDLKGKKSILEIGPGGGFALKYFADMGLRAKAVETSDSSSTFMRVKLGLEVENAMLETYDNLEQFDIVMLNHVLEHFLDLRGAMGKLYKLVAPGGLLYVRVPNHDSYDRRMMGKAWPAYLPFHISYFSEESLRQLFSQTGFEVASTSSFVSERFMHGAPTFARKIGRRLLRLLGREDQYKGRTIAIIGKKNL